MSESEKEEVVTVPKSLREVNYVPEKLEDLKRNFVLRDNLVSIIADFEKCYTDILDQKHLLNDMQLSHLKSDWFCAWCYGVVSAVDADSTFKRRFKMPEELKPKESLIITGPKDVEKAEGGLIL